MSQPDWPEEGHRPDREYRPGQRSPDDWNQPPAPPSGMSGGMKACVIIICVLGVSCLLCCGVFGYIFYSMARSFANPVTSNNPAEINAARDEIAKMTLPPGLAPKELTKVDNMFLSMNMVEYENPEHAELMMMEMRVKWAQGDMTAAMRQQLEQKRTTRINVGQMQNTKVETKNIKIRGQDYAFTFTKGEETAGKNGAQRAGAKGAPPKGAGAKGQEKGARKTEREQIFGTFGGRNGLVMINIDFDDTYKEADIVKMLENIQ